MRRVLAVAAMAATFGVGLALPAEATTTPADCTTVNPVAKTAVMTCTNRPAGTHWHLYVICFGPWLDSEANGNSVTGNGSSTASCPWGYALYPEYRSE